MLGQFVNNLAPGNFGAPGVYVYNAPAGQVTPPGPALNALGIVGTAQWGPLNLPTPFTNLSNGYQVFGPNTSLNNSIMRDAVACTPQANAMFGVRVTDATDTAATIVITDGASATIGTLTAVYTGSLPNGANASGVVTNPATAQLSVATGSLSSGGSGAPPQVRLAVTFPNASTEIFTVVAGTASAGLQMATLKANLLTAVNTGTATNAPSARWTWTSGASVATAITNIGTTFAATGGTDGATTITSSVLTGVDGVSGRKGLYALRGAINGGQYIFAGCYDTTLVQTMAAFNVTEGTRSGISFAIGTSTATALTTKATNSASDPTVDTFSDWLLIRDPWVGQNVYMAPAAKGEAVISALDYFQSPLGKPKAAQGGAVGIQSTDRLGNPLGGGEIAQRYSGGINYFTNASGVWQLASDKASDGKTNISDVRAQWFFGIGFMQVLAPFLGEPQSTSPTDATRKNARGAINSFMAQQLYPVQKISGVSNVCDLTNNSNTTIAQGFLIDNIAITTLAGVEFILVNSQVGVTVQSS